MAKEMNEYSQTTNVSSPSEHSGCAKVTGCYSEEFSRTSPDNGRRNPFHINYLDKLRYPVCSPSLFKSIEKAISIPCQETEILTSCDINESDIFYDETLDSETEKAAQETISKFFEDASKDLFVTPDKVTNSFLIATGEMRADEDISLSYICDPSTLQHDIHLSTTWTQTNITFPSSLPEEVEEALTLHKKQVETELKLAKCRVCDTVCGKHSQGTQTDDWEMNAVSFKKVTKCSQTILSFPKTLTEELEALLSSYETFFEEVYTDIRMSMLKRQLFSEHYVSSPQFHSSSPLSVLDDGSPLQSESSVTPQCASVSLRHYGSPMMPRDILSPTGISPIVKPSNTNRFLSKLDFVSSNFETPHSMSPSAFLRVRGAIFPSLEDVSCQRN
ncbi:uncharacterized protein LOC126457639 [Schistocerca serialis cubense]|uniref:uncharacterized protein LOC126457639 n=1 Tax=Schistocerca serialis cubense TaxID=2023355 RepID=UPI00214E7A31|nr:uncharacterized protein LOC126457639 [Schistocerca serialis cubense]XP_049950068.1 uncharacterized protein LOC126457639 [Schistocerca serialis cubense]